MTAPTIGRIIRHLVLTLVDERPSPPRVVQLALMMAAEVSNGYEIRTFLSSAAIYQCYLSLDHVAPFRHNSFMQLLNLILPIGKLPNCRTMHITSSCFPIHVNLRIPSEPRSISSGFVNIRLLSTALREPKKMFSWIEIHVGKERIA